MLRQQGGRNISDEVQENIAKGPDILFMLKCLAACFNTDFMQETLPDL
jgi:hypothetical protein